jgi:class 3 adenylate cyclase
VSIVFTDVVGSTEMLSRLGDEAAESLRRRHLAQLREVVASHGGREVKSLGDGLMIAFAVPSSALVATVDMQRAVDRHNVDADEPLAIRIGVATGECDVDGLDFHGTAVVEAARLCAVAEGGQILVTDLVRALARSRGSHRFEQLGRRAR